MDTKDLFKYRSVTACLRAAYDLISDNFTSILKKTWWAVLIYAIFLALTVYFRVPNKGLHDWGVSSPWASYILQTFVYAALWVTSFVASASIWNWINKKGLKFCLVRFTLPAVACQAIGAFVLGVGMALAQAFFEGYAAKAIPAKESLTTAYAITGGISIVLIILVLVVTLPFAYIIPRCMLTEKKSDIAPWKSYKCGLRHLGGAVKLGILGSIILGVICAVIMLPTFILVWAQITSQLGALNGDALGTPGYFTLLFLVVLTITLAVATYLEAWLGIAYAYLYGSTATLEEHRKNININKE